MPYKDPLKRSQYNKAYQRRYYQSKGDRARRKAKERRHKIRAWFDEIRRNTVCVDCGLSGEESPWLIEYHHRNPDDKEDEVGFLVGAGYSIERIEREMAKCDPLCPNCHRLHHWREKLATGKSVHKHNNTKSRKSKGAQKAHTARRKRNQAARNARKAANSQKKK